jgi:Cytochrome P450
VPNSGRAPIARSTAPTRPSRSPLNSSPNCCGCRPFADPEDFVLDRSPNPHVGFGFGPHRCPGAPLAKVMLKISLASVLERLPGLQRITQDVVWTPGESKNLRELRVRRARVDAAAG